MSYKFKNLLAYFELGNSAVHINSNQIKLMLILGGPEWKSEVLVGGLSEESREDTNSPKSYPTLSHLLNLNIDGRCVFSPLNQSNLS